jgi:hypothetical protein
MDFDGFIAACQTLDQQSDFPVTMDYEIAEIIGLIKEIRAARFYPTISASGPRFPTLCNSLAPTT